MFTYPIMGAFQVSTIDEKNKNSRTLREAAMNENKCELCLHIDFGIKFEIVQVKSIFLCLHCAMWIGLATNAHIGPMAWASLLNSKLPITKSTLVWPEGRLSTTKEVWP